MPSGRNLWRSFLHLVSVMSMCAKEGELEEVDQGEESPR